LSDGGWVVTWMFDQQDGSSGGIYQQRYDADGSASGTSVKANTYTDSSQDQPAITALDDGGWLLTWQSSGQDGSAYGIYQQRFDRSGSAEGGETRVNTTTAGNQNYPTATTLADGGWVVTWTGQDGDSFGILQQRYDAGGHVVGSETLVNVSTAGQQQLSEVTALADGGWVVSWNGADADTPSKLDVFQRHFAPDVIGTGFGEKLEGSSWDEMLIGYGGNDTLDGKGGADVMIGGAGNDTYVVDNTGDDVQEMAGRGIDTIQASITFSLQSDMTVENITLTGSSAINATGNTLANMLTGNKAANKISGLGGADTIDGGKGNDTLTGGTGADHFLFKAGTGTDTVKDFAATGNAHDVIDLSDMDSIMDYDDLKANHMTQHGADAWIVGTDSDKLVLKGVDIHDLGKGDFVF
jgi:Ca2+-binding RTX toxin-like protein